MTEQDKPGFLLAITALAELFGRELSDAGLELYFRSLRDLSPAEFKMAVESCARTCRHFPRPAEILEAAHGSGDSRAIEAWIDAWGLVSSVGSYQTPEIYDPVTAKTIEAMGGWPAFCLTEDSESWHRKRFIDTWIALDKRREHIERTRLAGIADRENARLGCGPDPDEDAEILAEIAKNHHQEPS